MTEAITDYSTIRIGKKTYRKAVIKKAFTNLFAALFLILFVYLSIAATVVRFVPVTNNIAVPILIKNNTFDGGNIPSGQSILISMTEKVDHSLLGNLKNSVIPQSNTSVVNVVAGPYGKINHPSNSLISIDNKPYQLNLKGNIPEFLDNDYMVTCVQGDCEIGVSFVVPKDYIYGIAIGNY